MKTLGDKIKEWAVMGLLCSTLVTAGWVLREVQVLKKSAVEGQKFQKSQGELNVKYEFVLDFVIDDIKEKMDKNEKESDGSG